MTFPTSRPPATTSTPLQAQGPTDPLAAEYGEIYTPPPDAIRPGLEKMHWRKRVYKPTGEPQFLVMADPAMSAAIRNACFASGFTPQAAGLSAERRLARLSNKPEDFQPALAGAECSFDLVLSAEGTVLVHRCLDAHGAELGRGDTRAAAAELAAMRLTSRLHPGAMSLKQFAEVCATACVRPGRGRTEMSTIFDGTTEAMGPTRCLLSQVYDLAPSLRIPGESKVEFTRRKISEILRDAKFREDVLHFEIAAPEERDPLVFHLVMHRDAVLPSVAIRITHRQAEERWAQLTSPQEPESEETDSDSERRAAAPTA